MQAMVGSDLLGSLWRRAKHLDRYTCLLLACLLLGAWLRIVGLTRGTSDFVLPEQLRAGATTAFYRFHPDEALVIGAALKPIDLLQPAFTVYGVLPVFVLRGALQATGFVLDWGPLSLDAPESARRIYYTARVLAALFSCATLWLVWLLGRRYFGPLAAGIATAFVAFAPGTIQQAHFYIVDGLFLTLSTAALYAASRAVEGGERRWYVLAGALIGATAAVRLNGVILGLVLAAGHTAARISAGGGRQWRDPRAWVPSRRLWLAAGTALAGLLVLEPFLLTDPGLLGKGQSTDDLDFAVEIARGAILQPWTLVDVHAVPYLDQWRGLLPLIAGWPLTVAFALGVGFVVWRPSLPRGMMLAWCVLYYLLIGGLQVQAVRYMLPLLPFFALFTGAACAWLWQRPLSPRWRAMVRAGIGVLLFYSVANGVAFTRIYQAEDSRIEAARWIAANVPGGSSIGVETGAFTLSALVSRERYQLQGLHTVYLFYTGPYMLCRQQVQYLRELVQPLDYLAIVDANRYRQFTAVPDLYPAVAGFYQQLVQGQLGFDLAVRYQHSPGLFGLDLNDEAAEPSFTGYDHPAVLVFKRRSPAAVEQAFARWERQLAASPDCADRLLQRVAQDLNDGAELRAQPTLQELMATHPNLKIAHLLDAEIQSRSGNPQLAAAALRRYQPDYPHPLSAHHPAIAHRIPGASAATLVELDLPELAVRVLEAGVKSSVSYTYGASRDMAESYVAVGRLSFARGQLPYLEKALYLSTPISGIPVAYNTLARLAFFSGRFGEAVELWERSARLDADQTEVCESIGRTAMLHLRDQPKAAYYLDRAVRLDPRLGAVTK